MKSIIHTVVTGPQIHRLTGRHRSVVHGDRPGRPAKDDDVVQSSGNLFSAEGCVGVKSQAPTRVLIAHREHSYPAIIRQSLGIKSHVSIFVPAYSLALRQSLLLYSLVAFPH